MQYAILVYSLYSTLLLLLLSDQHHHHHSHRYIIPWLVFSSPNFWSCEVDLRLLLFTLFLSEKKHLNTPKHTYTRNSYSISNSLAFSKYFLRIQSVFRFLFIPAVFILSIIIINFVPFFLFAPLFSFSYKFTFFAKKKNNQQ